MALHPSWLCPTENDRERFREMQNGLRTARLVTIVCIAALMVSLVPRGGWPILAFGGAMGLIVLVGGVRLGAGAGRSGGCSSRPSWTSSCW